MGSGPQIFARPNTAFATRRPGLRASNFVYALLVNSEQKSAHSWVARTPCRDSASDSGLPDSSLRLHALPQPVDCGLNAARTVGNAERLEAHFDDAECPQHHGSIDMP